MRAAAVASAIITLVLCTPAGAQQRNSQNAANGINTSGTNATAAALDNIATAAGQTGGLKTTDAPTFGKLTITGSAGNISITDAGNNFTISTSASAGISEQSPALLFSPISEFTGWVQSPSSGHTGSNFMEMDAIGSGETSFLEMVSAQGTAGSLSGTKSGDVIGSLFFTGTRDSTHFKSAVSVAVAATQDWSLTQAGTSFAVSTAANGSITPAQRIFVDGSGNTEVQNGSLILTAIPTSAGSGGLYVCVDTAGVTYKKSSCP